jgi:hypothetical protein
MKPTLKNLLSTWPAGTIRSVAALKALGYSQSLITSYRNSGWLTSAGDGAVFRTGDKVTIFGGLYALQQDLMLDVHIGGRSALELLGRGHFVRSSEAQISLFGTTRRLPTWFSEFDWEVKFKYLNISLFDSASTTGLENYNREAFSIKISAPLRAMLEFLSRIPMNHSVEEAKELMQGLTALRVQKVEEALQSCNSYKVRRLFLLLAEECGHAWVKKLDIESIDLGKGPRNLVKNGKLHKKYKITVPASILAHEGT